MNFKQFLLESTGIHVRDTWVGYSELDKLPVERKNEILKLIDEFKKIPYIDARTELGPNQVARMSDNKKKEMLNNATKVFAIEMKIKQLLKSDSQLNKEENEEQKRKINQRLGQIDNYIKNIENLGTMSHTKTGKLKPSYQRSVDVHMKEKQELEDKLKKLGE